jgi:hypothetical protein
VRGASWRGSGPQALEYGEIDHSVTMASLIMILSRQCQIRDFSWV